MEISTLLVQIKELYSLIKQDSLFLVNNFSEQTLEEFLITRENLLRQIYEKEALYSKLNENKVSLSANCLQLKKEIRELIISINSIDSCITDMISKSMSRIKNELKGLYSSSKAALAYSNHSRT